MSQEYASQGKKQRGILRAYIVKMTGLSMPQTTRLIRKYRAEGVVEAVQYRRRRLPVKYTSQDVARLVEVDRAHSWLNGAATVRIIQREHEGFGKSDCARLGEISVPHLYNLRGSARYRKLAAKWEATRPTVISIGERRKPNPQGRPGYLRIDTVHQGDWNGAKGVYHINAVDEGDAVAGGGLRGADQRAIPAAGVGSDPASIFLCNCGDSFGQRLRIRF